MRAGGYTNEVGTRIRNEWGDPYLPPRLTLHSSSRMTVVIVPSPSSVSNSTCSLSEISEISETRRGKPVVRCYWYKERTEGRAEYGRGQDHAKTFEEMKET